MKNKKGESMTKKLYFCTACRKKVNKIENLLFVEESKRGFCSEACIINFFSPYMEAFDKEELKQRELLGLNSSEGDIGIYQDKNLFEKVLYTPTEIWLEKNEIGEEFYTHILKINEEDYFIVICTYYEGEPAFVYFKTITKSLKLLKYYQREVYLDQNDINKNIYQSDKGSDLSEGDKELLDEIQLPAEIVEDIDLKKSELLAELLERRSDTDIPFENYPDYDDYLSLTLDDADDEFQSEDKSGDDIITFIKSFKKDNKAFFYIAICLRVTIPTTNDIALLPVLSFPSTDESLYTHYAVGEKKNNRLTS